MLSASIAIYAALDTLTITDVDKKAAQAFTNWVRAAASEAKFVGESSANTSNVGHAWSGVPQQAESWDEPGTDILDGLERLAALKEKGVLTDTEFASQKARLLDE